MHPGNTVDFGAIYTVSQKNWTLRLLFITLPDVDWFSKFFYW